MAKVSPMPRRTPGKMNQTESRYADQLQLLQAAGEIERWRFEALNFRLAPKTFYLPDFMVVYRDRIEMHEIKDVALLSKSVLSMIGEPERALAVLEHVPKDQSVKGIEFLPEIKSIKQQRRR